MPDHAAAYRNRAALARSFGDLPTADWCDEQARIHERLNATRANLAQWGGLLERLGRDDG